MAVLYTSHRTWWGGLEGMENGMGGVLISHVGGDSLHIEALVFDYDR